MKVTAQNAVEFRTHEFSTEASDLGLKPGQVPARIPTTLGNGCDFVFVKMTECAFYYNQVNGVVELVVFND